MNTVAGCDNHSVELSLYGFAKQNNTESLLKPRNPLFPGLVSAPAQQSIKHYTLLANGRRFIDGNLPLSDILPNLPSEIYALVKNGNNRKYIDRILYISLAKITPNVC